MIIETAKATIRTKNPEAMIVFVVMHSMWFSPV
jgi:hypothetical protein